MGQLLFPVTCSLFPRQKRSFAAAQDDRGGHSTTHPELHSSTPTPRAIILAAFAPFRCCIVVRREVAAMSGTLSNTSKSDVLTRWTGVVAVVLPGVTIVH